MIDGNQKCERKVVAPRQGHKLNNRLEPTAPPRLNLNVEYQASLKVCFWPFTGFRTIKKTRIGAGPGADHPILLRFQNDSGRDD